MKNTSYVVLFVISVIVLALNLWEIKPVSSISSLLFALWSLAPWLYAFGLVFFVNHGKKLTFILAVSVALGIFGLWGIIDAMYIHLDPQSGLVFIFIPLWQLVAFLLATPFLLLFKNPADS